MSCCYKELTTIMDIKKSHSGGEGLAGHRTLLGQAHKIYTARPSPRLLPAKTLLWPACPTVSRQTEKHTLKGIGASRRPITGKLTTLGRGKEKAPGRKLEDTPAQGRSTSELTRPGRVNRATRHEPGASES